MKSTLQKLSSLILTWTLMFPGALHAARDGRGGDGDAGFFGDLPSSFSQFGVFAAGIILLEPLRTVVKSVSDKFSKAFLIPRIDVAGNKNIPPYIWEMAPSGHSNSLKVNDLILNRETHVKINTFLLALKEAAATNDPLPSLMLYGPPGTGKTEIAKRLVNEGPFLLKTFSGTELSTRPAFELKHLFDWANRDRGKTKVVIFIDEVESLLKANAFGIRGGPLTEFLKANGSQSPYYTFVVATNFIDKIDRAAFRRFNNPVNIGLPDASERVKIYELYVRGLLKRYKHIELEEDFLKDVEFRKTLAKEAEGLSGSDLKYIAQNNRAEAELNNNNVISKEAVIRHLREKKAQYLQLDETFEEAEAKRKKDLQLQLMARKLQNLENKDFDDDEDEEEVKPIKGK